MALCNLGFFGTRYVRQEPVVEELTLVEGQTFSIDVERIRSEFTIGTKLHIKLRLSELSTSSELVQAVTIIERDSHTEVQIDSAGLIPGTY